MIAAALIAVQIVVLVPDIRPAAANTPFGPIFSTNAPGDIVYVSNTLATCIDGTPNCAAAQAGGSFSNNSFGGNMTVIDADSDGATATSSFADYSLPPGGQILWAGLYWSGYYTGANADKDDVLFQTPASGGYVPITATFTDGWDNNDDYYMGHADVTALVQAGGSGTYGVADVAMTNNNGNTAGGWSIVIVQEDPAAAWKNLTVNHGFTGITSSIPLVDITVSGFNAPPIGPVDAEIGLITLEGDLPFVGDYVEFNGNRLTNGLNPTDNFLNSSISTDGAFETTTNPAYPSNTLGYDADIITTSGLVAPNASSATVRLGTVGDWYFPSVVTTAIEIFVPNLSTNLTKTATDLNGAAVHPGDIIEYAISFDNTGEDPAEDTVVSDVIPAGTTYVPNSLVVVSDNSPAGTRTDAQDGDTAWFDGSSVYFNIGSGANSTDGGQVDPISQGGQAYEVRFQVQVDDSSSGLTVSNVASVDYIAQFTGDSYTADTAPVDNLVEPLVDLSVTKTDTADPVTAGEIVTYTIQATNDGPSDAANAQVVDTLPPGLSFVAAGSDPSCSAVTSVITCSLGTLAVGTQSLTINALVDEDTTTASVTNSVTISSDTTEYDFTDNTDSEPTAIERDADLRVTKSAPGSIAAGNQLTYTITVTNDGPSSAQNVQMIDALPGDVVLDSASATAGGVCTGAVVCDWSLLAAGASSTVTVVVDVPPSLAASTRLTNAVSVTSDDPDSDTSNNSDSVDTDVTAEADLSITKTLTTSPLLAGGQASYDLLVTNNGPSDATNVVITDVVPGGLSFVSASSTPACSEAAGTVTCNASVLSSVSLATFTLVFDVDPTLTTGANITNTASVTSDATDSNASNDSDRTTDTIGREADVYIAKDDNLTTVNAGGQITYTLDYGNNGPSTANSVTITDTLPAGVTFNSSPDCTFSAPSTVTCTVGTLAPGAVGSATMIVDVDAGLPDTTTLTNSASITADETDPVSSNDTSSVSTDIDRVVNLNVEKDDVADPVFAGETVEYTITLTNTGPSDETNAVLTDTLPAGLSFVSVSDTTNCSETTGVITCTYASMLSGTQQVVTVIADVDPTLADGTVLSNTVTADGDVADVVDDTEETTARARADLQMTKIAPGAAAAGTQLTYTLTATNNGPSTADTATLVDTLPAGMTYASHNVTTGSASCSESMGVFTCALGDLSPGATTVIELTVDVDPSLADGTTTTNGALLSSSTPDPDPSDNSSTADTIIAETADLETTKVTLTSPVIAGADASFQVTVTNNGPSTATNVTVSDTLPAGFSFDAAASSAGCVAGVTCSAGTLLPGESATFTIGVDVGSGVAEATYTNSATGSADQADPDSGNDTDTSTIDVEQQADVQIVKNADTPTITPGTIATWTLAVTNNGASDATNVVVTDTLPAGLTFDAAGSSIECVAGVTCTLGTILPGDTVNLTLAAAVDAGVTASITNTATVTTDTPDPTPGNNTSSETTPVQVSADISVVKLGPSDAVAGDQITYTLTVENAGPAIASNVVIDDLLPPGTTFDAAGSSPECSAGVTCALGDIGVGGTVVVTLVVDVDPTMADGTLISNTASVRSDAQDPNSADNDSTADTTIASEADLRVSKTAPTFATSGDTVVYDITFTNDGPSVATNVSLSDIMPTGFTATTVTPSGSVVCSNSGTSVGCSLATMTPGQAETVEITATIDPSVPDGSTNINSVSVSADQTDPDTSDNSATAPVTVSGAADLEVTKTSAPTTPVAGETITYTITVVNNGPSDAVDVELIDTLPASLSPDTANSLEMSCGILSQTVTCTQALLADGGTATVTITATVDSNLPSGSSIDNSATASAATGDPDTGNNTGTDSTTTDAVADLALTKTTTKDPAVAGEWHPFTIDVTNNGPSTATGVTITDTLPGGTTFNAALSDAGCSESLGTVTCAVPDIVDGGSASVVIVVDLPASTPDGSTITNSATVDADQSDPNAGDNTDLVSVMLDNSADLSIVKDGDNAAVAGEAYSWTFTIANAGPSDADAVSISDPLPAGTSMAPGTDGRCSEAVGVLTCTIGGLAAGTGGVLTVVVDVDPSVAAATDLINTATISSATDDPDTSDNESTDTATSSRTSDLDISKRDLADPVIAGEEVAWEITVTNLGPSDAANVIISDTLPPEVTFSSVDDARCSEATGVVTCSIAALAAGDDVVVTIRADVDTAVGDGTVINNSASATSDSSALVSDTEPTTVQRSSDLRIDKSSDGLAVAGLQQSYSITVVNDGPSDADNVVVTDVLPTGFSFASSTEPSCTPAGQIVTCSLGTIAAGDSDSFTLVADVLNTASPTSRNTATVTSDSVDPNAANDSDEDDTAVGEEADIQVTKRALGSLVPGTRAEWEIEVSNVGPSAADAVTVVDVLDGAVTFDSTASSPSCTAVGQTITCAAGTLLTGESMAFVVAGEIRPDVTGTLTNSASGSSITPDPIASNNTASTTDVLTPSADLSVGKAAVSGSVIAGQPLDYEITVDNEGPSTATNIDVTDIVPTGLVFDPSRSDPSCMYDDASRTATCAIGALGPAQTATIDIAFVIENGVPAGTLFINTASVSSATADPDTANNDAQAMVPSAREVNLSLTKELREDDITPGTAATWLLTVANAGPSVASNVQVIDELPDGLAFIEAESDPACAAVGNVVTCSLSLLTPGGSKQFKLTTAVANDVPLGSLTNAARVTSTDGGGTSTEFTADVVANDAGLSVDKLGPANAIDVGESFDWRVTVTNDGPEPITVPVTITDPLPDGLDYVSMSTEDDLWCTEVGDTLTCRADALAVDESVSFTIRTKATRAGDFTNVVTVDARGVTEERAVTAAAAATVEGPPGSPGSEAPLAFTGRSLARTLLFAWSLVTIGVVMVLVSRESESTA